MLLLPDQFDYIGPVDLTEYNVRRTVIMGDQDTAIRVKVTRPPVRQLVEHSRSEI